LTRGPGLALEALDGAGRVSGVRKEHLDGDALLQPNVHRLVDDAHPALADRPDDLVFASNDVARLWKLGRHLVCHRGRRVAPIGAPCPALTARRLPRIPSRR